MVLILYALVLIWGLSGHAHHVGLNVHLRLSASALFEALLSLGIVLVKTLHHLHLVNVRVIALRDHSLHFELRVVHRLGTRLVHRSLLELLRLVVYLLRHHVLSVYFVWLTLVLRKSVRNHLLGLLLRRHDLLELLLHLILLENLVLNWVLLHFLLLHLLQIVEQLLLLLVVYSSLHLLCFLCEVLLEQGALSLVLEVVLDIWSCRVGVVHGALLY